MAHTYENSSHFILTVAQCHYLQTHHSRNMYSKQTIFTTSKEKKVKSLKYSFSMLRQDQGRIVTNSQSIITIKIITSFSF
mmetsp:Transcript_59251/g.125960  ORF Transcript_59251/g.125960 Transcript_59251/m.125960 type:complete len:80 (+) Transcript_59251:290-529(+)